MSWSISAAGTVAEIREAIRRHHHHYWQRSPDLYSATAEADVRNMVLGHALRVADPDHRYILEGSGSFSLDQYAIQVSLRPLLMPTPAVPADASTPFDVPSDDLPETPTP